MANQKISDLSGLSFAANDDELVIVDSSESETKKISFGKLTGSFAISGGAYHDSFSDYVADEHIDWTTDQGTTNIDSRNYTDNDTTAHASFSQLDYASAGHTGFASSTSLTTVSGAGVAVSGGFIVTSGTGVIISGATVTNADDISTNTSNLSTVSGAVVINKNNLLIVSGAGVGVSGALVVVSGATVLNTAKVTNVITNLSEGTSTLTTVKVNSSDGDNATLASASTSRAGLLSKVKFD